MYSWVSPSDGERRRTKYNFLHLPVLYVERQFVSVPVCLLDVKSLVEHDGES